MKKLFTLSAVGMLALCAQAKHVQQGTPARVPGRNCVHATTTPSAFLKAFTPTTANKGTAATVFYKDTFNATSLTTGGWVAAGNTGAAGTWTFTKVAAPGPYSIGAIQSSSAAGGWMLYDSDDIGAVFNSTPQIGTLTSPSISCTGHNYVGVVFQQYMERYQDTFYVQVSSNGGSSWTTYPIYPNMSLGTNESTDNPAISSVNISPVAANQANVKVRFYYSGAYAGGGYNWMIDDFELVDLDPIDIGLDKTGILMTLGGGTGVTPVGTEPKLFIDSIFPITSVNNYGGQAVGAITVNANIYNGASSVYSKSYPFTAIPINAFDSIADFTSKPGLTGATSGQYLAVFTANVTGDANTANNVDTTMFNVSDSSMCTFAGYTEAGKKLNSFFLLGNYYLHAPQSASRPKGTSYYMGSIFEIPSGTKKDTITSVSVGLYTGTTVGQQIQVELYKYDDAASAFDYKGHSAAYTITAADVPASANSLTMTTIPLSIGTLKSYTIADVGTWVAVVRPVSPSLTSSILIASMQPAAPSSLVGHYGVSDTADAPLATFGVNLAATSTYFTHEEVPAVVVNFGNAKALSGNVGVHDVNNVFVGNAFPNPANTVINVPVSVGSAAAPVTVSIYNMLGQLMMSQDMGNLAAGQSKTAVFSTTSLASGMYLCTVSSNGERVTNHVAIAH